MAPPDTNGDVGPNHYVQWNNLTFEVFNKSGVSVLGPRRGNLLFTGFGGVCETTNDGDPIVLYDQFADRWILSQFAIDTGVQCVAVSTGPDPTGTYARYAFDVSPGNNDYPKLGVWPDAYYVTFNEFAPSFTRAVAVALEKPKMLTGDPTAASVIFGVTAPAGTGCTGSGDCYFSLQPSHAEGTAAPPPGSPNYFLMSFDDEVWGNGGTPTDQYKIWEFHVDWATPANSTFTGPVAVPTAEFNANLCDFGGCIPQQGGEPLDTLSQFTMYHLVYRNFGTHESLYVSHSVNLGSNRAGVRFAEIRSPGTTPTLFQEGTHGPTDAFSRWMPSVNVDKDGNLAIGYSISSATSFPGIAYVGRLAGDPVGTLPQTETVMFAGLGSQTATFNRWGDYSALSIDESDGCTFWYTTEYYDATASFDWKTRIGTFKFANCTAGPSGTLSGTVTSAGNGNPIAGATITADSFSTTTDGSGNYSLVLPEGTYDVTATAFGFDPGSATGVVITDGQTTDQDFSLTPQASIVLDGFVTDGSGAGWPLYAQVVLTPTGGSPTTLWTNPANGYYQTNVLAGTTYTITVTAQMAGYLVATRTVAIGSSDRQENFGLIVNAGSCSVPGYASIIDPTPVVTTDFTGGIPAGWTVTNNTTACNSAGANPMWNTANPGNRANLTGGTTTFAIADSDRCGSTVQFDSNLVSPVINMSALPAASLLQVTFNSDYRDLCTPSAGDEVKLQVFNGTAWVDVFTFCGPGGGLTNRRGPRVEQHMAASGNPANAQIRWRYKGGWDWWWEVDNVAIRTGRCVYGGGFGIFYGNVYDENTELPLNGATVTLDSGQTATTAATPNDPNRDDGFYIISAPLNFPIAPGTRTITVSKTRYGTVSRDAVPVPDGVQREDFVLPAPQFILGATELRQRLAIGASADQTLTITNTGSIAGTFGLLEIDEPAASPVSGIIEPLLQSPFFDASTKQGQLRIDALSTEALGVGSRSPKTPIITAAGEWVNDFPTTLDLSWGTGYDTNRTDLWVSNPAAGGGDDLNHHFLTDGTKTGDTMTAAFGGVFAADLTYNQRTRTLWQVNVGGDNCLYELDPIAQTATGNKICAAFGTSMRGVAYNPVADTYFVGSWNLLPNGRIMEIKPDGTILRSNTTLGLAISGVAYNPRTGHLFAQVNDSIQLVYVIDTNGPGFTVIGAFPLSASAGGNAYAAFEGAGLEIDCAGTLWSSNQTTNRVFANESGETNVCVTEIPWLSEDPTSGTVPANGSTDVTVTFDSAGVPPGCREAQLLVTNNTPYGDDALEVGLTVAFNDVAQGAFADAFIHAIAGAGISFGCGAGNFCPLDNMTRRLMSVWLLRARFGSDYNPPPATGIFADVPPESFAADFIEDLFRRGITGGCASNPLRFCPDQSVTRAEMSVFLLRTKEGPSFVPPPCGTPMFTDVPANSPFCPFVEEVARRGITAGCATNPPRFCPSGTATRAQMSVFVSTTFGIAACQQ